MKQFLFLFTFLFLLFTSVLAKTYTIVAIQSYGPDHICGTPQLIGTINYLDEQKLDYKLYVFYMYTKSRYTTYQQKTERGRKAIQFALSRKPDLIIAYDDNALVYAILMNHNKLKNVPIVFSGINQPYAILKHEWKIAGPNDYPVTNITGIMEYVDTLDIIPFLHKIDIFIDKLYVLYDSTTTAEYAKRTLFEQYNRESYLISDLELIPIKIQTKKDVDTFFETLKVTPGVAVASLVQNIKDVETGRTMHGLKAMKYIAHWSIRKKVLNICLYNEEFVEHGVCDLGYVLSFKRMGRLVGDYTIQILVKGKKPQDLPILTILEGKTAVNRQRLQKLGFRLSTTQLQYFDVVW